MDLITIQHPFRPILGERRRHPMQRDSLCIKLIPDFLDDRFLLPFSPCAASSASGSSTISWIMGAGSIGRLSASFGQHDPPYSS